MPPRSKPKRLPAPPPPRRWFLDALAALAFFLAAVTLGKGATRTVGPFAGLIVFALAGGMGWHFARAAWSGYAARRGRRGL